MNVVQLEPSLKIKCPHCQKRQRMVYARYTRVWFPVAPYCCEVMGIADSDEWNQALDVAIYMEKNS
jgi:hypothetical protein